MSEDTQRQGSLLPAETVRFIVSLSLLVVAQPLFIGILLLAKSQALGVLAGAAAMLTWLLMVCHIIGADLI